MNHFLKCLLIFSLPLFFTGCENGGGAPEKGPTGEKGSLQTGNADIKEISIQGKSSVSKFLAKGKVTVFEFGAKW